MRNKRILSIGLPVLIGAALIYTATAIAQVGPLQVIPLAQGFTTENIKLHAKGPNVVLTVKMTLAPFGEVPWHTHAGPVIFVVTQGVLTQYHANGCVSVHQPGSVIVEEEGDVHRIVN